MCTDICSEGMQETTFNGNKPACALRFRIDSEMPYVS
jgi:hypothetical protein